MRQRNLSTSLDSFLFSRFVIVVFLDVFFKSLLESSMTKSAAQIETVHICALKNLPSVG